MSLPVGVVLAGGEGVRMGGPKGGLPFRGTTLAARAVEVLRPLCDEVVLSVAAGAVLPVPAVAAIEDSPPPGRGPLAGLASVFSATGGADLLVLACDYPFVEAPFCRELWKAAEHDPDRDVVLPVDATGRDHPLVACWRRRSADAVSRALARGELRVGSVLGVLRLLRLGAADFRVASIDGWLENWNSPADRRAPGGGG